MRYIIDFAFTNTPERIRTSYNLITGLSDHNMILIVRNFSKTALNWSTYTKFRSVWNP